MAMEIANNYNSYTTHGIVENNTTNSTKKKETEKQQKHRKVVRQKIQIIMQMN